MCFYTRSQLLTAARGYWATQTGTLSTPPTLAGFTPQVWRSALTHPLFRGSSVARRDNRGQVEYTEHNQLWAWTQGDIADPVVPATAAFLVAATDNFLATLCVPTALAPPASPPANPPCVVWRTRVFARHSDPAQDPALWVEPGRALCAADSAVGPPTEAALRLVHAQEQARFAAPLRAFTYQCVNIDGARQELTGRRGRGG